MLYFVVQLHVIATVASIVVLCVVIFVPMALYASKVLKKKEEEDSGYTAPETKNAVFHTDSNLANI